MIDPVDFTLDRWRTTLFEWGNHDCMLSIGDYITLRGGKDVSKLFRGLYCTESEAMAFMRQYGGAHGLIEMTGIERVDGPPKRGDVVALAYEGEEGGSIGALCTGGMIAARLYRGVIEVNARFVRIEGVWRCPA